MGFAHFYTGIFTNAALFILSFYPHANSFLSLKTNMSPIDMQNLSLRCFLVEKENQDIISSVLTTGYTASSSLCTWLQETRPVLTLIVLNRIFYVCMFRTGGARMCYINLRNMIQHAHGTSTGQDPNGPPVLRGK